METKKTNAERQEVQTWIREQMNQGLLPMEPEHELPKAKSGKRQNNQKWSQTRGPSTKEREMEDIQDDDFFGEDTI